MLTAGTIINRAALIAKAPQYTVATSTFGNIGLDMLNAVLRHICLTYDMSAARRVLNFNFDLNLTSFFGSGPYPLPIDYLRVSGSSGEAQKGIWWVFEGVPYPMIPCDLSEFDMQVEQAGLQSYPWLWATDMSNSSIFTSSPYAWSTTIAAMKSSPNATVAANLGINAGDGIAGEGIVPGTTVASYTSGTGAIVLSQGAAGTVTAGSVFGGSGAPVGYTYPPPSGAFPVTLRYQALMPPVVNVNTYPWFPDEKILIDGVAGEMMKVTDDSRVVEYVGDGQRTGRADRALQNYFGNLDDKRSRPQTVEMDRRRFGPSMRVLRNTKTIGW